MPYIRSGKSSLAQCLSPFGFGSFFRMTNGKHWLLSTLLQRRRVVHSCWISPIYDLCKIFLSPPIFPHFKLIFISCISSNLPYIICLSFTPFPLSHECHIWKPPCILWRMGKSMQLWWRVGTWGTCSHALHILCWCAPHFELRLGFLTLFSSLYFCWSKKCRHRQNGNLSCKPSESAVTLFLVATAN